MRDIRFRAWDKHNNIMRDVIDICFHTIEPYISCPSLAHDDEWETLFAGEYDLMQYTGIKDRNGVAIYEGDIVEGYSVYPDGETFESYIFGEVYYSNRGTWDCESFLLGGLNEQVEIIGNIHDNPELMGEKK